MNMNGMNVGNGAGGPMPQMNNGTNGATPRTGNDQEPQVDYKIRLHTYIYDYFLKHEQYDCARQLLKSSLTLNTRNNHSPARRPNGIDDNSMETDSKDDIDPKRPHDLPLPELNDANDNTSFLLEWFSLFWDMFFAHRKLKPASAQALQYMQHTQVSAAALVYIILGLTTFGLIASITDASRAAIPVFATTRDDARESWLPKYAHSGEWDANEPE